MKNHHLNYKKNSQLLFFSISFFLLNYLFFTALYDINENKYIFAISFLWMNGILFCLLKIYHRIFFLMFLIAFFNFLIGRSFLIALGIRKEYYIFSSSESVAGYQIIFISLLSIFISYILLEKLILKKSKKINYDTEYFKIIRKISKQCFYFTYFFLIFTVIATILYVMRNGYTSIYININSKAPLMVKKIGDIANYMFYIFLGTMPSKKEIKYPCLLYVFYLVLTLGTGGRFDFVIGVFSLFTYTLLRNKINNYRNEKWVGVKKVIFSILAGIVFMGFFSIYNTARFGYKVNLNKSPSYLFIKFIYDQGISVNINKRIFKYEKEIPKDRLYSFDSLISFYQRNIRGRLLKGRYYTGPSVDRALNGNSLGDKLSYIILKDRYLKGEGVGSSYIAEVYHDFGYLGLVLYSVIISILLLYIKRLVYSGYFFKFTFSFFLFMTLLKIPRARADSWILKIIDPMMWISFIIIFLLYNIRKIIIIKNRKEKIDDD